ncbi:MAG: DUF3108 domain-containing protein [Gammaproteobacteria bacterium]|nr:DUF3108 domain-containing protein [Gammaproteobacteria bacterium]
MEYHYKKRSQWKAVLLFFTFSFQSLISCSVFAEPLKTKFPFISGETLHYKLSYRGLLTSMIWADLADVKMTYLTDKKTPEQRNAYQFELFLTTEYYTKAEVFQPVRYTYTTTVDTELQRTVLVEEIDLGKNQSHDFLWLDWENKETQLFKKREKELENSGFLGMDAREVWEEDGKEPVPDFLGDYPLLADQKTYLIHKESGDKIERSQILDPLSLIYTLRATDFASTSEINSGLQSGLQSGFKSDFNKEKEIAVVVSDDIRLYHVKKMALEELSVNGKIHEGTKYKIQTDEKKDNFYYVWLSNDEKKVPLRLAMDAPLGKLEIDLVGVSHGERNEQ